MEVGKLAKCHKRLLASCNGFLLCVLLVYVLSYANLLAPTMAFHNDVSVKLAKCHKRLLASCNGFLICVLLVYVLSCGSLLAPTMAFHDDVSVKLANFKAKSRACFKWTMWNSLCLL